MTKKRRASFPPPRANKAPAPAPVSYATPPTVAVINTRAGTGRLDIAVGMRVTIIGGGLYSGETAVVEALVNGVIPAAAVRTEAGRTRRVRTIDLAPVTSRAADQAQGPAKDQQGPA